MTGIPDHLAHLAPTLDALAAYAPDDLDEDNPDAFDIVETAVRNHLQGMDVDAATKAVKDDVAALEIWTATPEAPRSASYVYGVMLGITMYGAVDEFLK